MKVVEEKMMGGHQVKALPPGYDAPGAYPETNVSMRSSAKG